MKCRALLLLLLTAVGCESNLSAAKVEKLQLRQTTEEQMKALFGDPDSQGLMHSSTGSSCYYRYYSVDRHGPFGADVMSLLVEMRDNRMTGYVYASASDKDLTKLDAAAISTLKPGISTQSDVTALLGPPAGHVLLPSLIKEVIEVSRPDTQEVWVYTSGEDLKFAPGRRSSVGHGLIAFDKAGRVQKSLVLKQSLQY